jgi:hypothetical protein
MAVALAAAALPVSAQRYLPGMGGVQALGGTIEGARGYYLHGGYAWYTPHKNRWVAAAEYLRRGYGSEVGAIPLAQLTAELGYLKLLASDAGKSFFVAVGVSALTGYETVNFGKKVLPNGAVLSHDSRWIYGAAAALEAEYYLDDRYVVLLTVKERVAGGSSVGMLHTLFGVGVKYILE